MGDYAPFTDFLFFAISVFVGNELEFRLFDSSDFAITFIFSFKDLSKIAMPYKLDIAVVSLKFFSEWFQLFT